MVLARRVDNPKLRFRFAPMPGSDGSTILGENGRSQ
jgi:hypothetical protein